MSLEVLKVETKVGDEGGYELFHGAHERYAFPAPRVSWQAQAPLMSAKMSESCMQARGRNIATVDGEGITALFDS